jgi:hypothetical protein
MKSSFFHQDDVELAMQIEPKWYLTELNQAVSGVDVGFKLLF